MKFIKNTVSPLMSPGRKGDICRCKDKNSHGATNIEVVFSFDTTGSMSKCLDEVRDKIQEMVKQLIRDIPGIRIGIIAHGDYCDKKYSYVIQTKELSTDADSICDFVSNVSETGGGDWQECYELALQEARNFNWSPSHSKALVMIGDSIPHSPEESERKIDWKVELQKLAEMEVKVYGVQVYDEDAATPFYKALANATGGEYIPLKDFHHITEVFTGLCYVEASDRQFDAHKETISNFRPETGSAHIFFTEEMDELQFTDEDLLRIHSAIHSGATEVQFQGEQHPISTGKSGCRRVIIKGITFIEQNKTKKNSHYAKMAGEGKQITWFIQNGNWGSIIDGKIAGKNDKKKLYRRRY